MSSKVIQLQSNAGSFESKTTNANTVADLLIEQGVTGQVSTSVGGVTADSAYQIRNGDVISIVTTNKRGG